MATKKQKRLAAKEKHDHFMEELRRSGLEAQRKDREHRAWQAEQARRDREAREKKSRQKTTTKKAVSKLKSSLSDEHEDMAGDITADPALERV